MQSNRLLRRGNWGLLPVRGRNDFRKQWSIPISAAGVAYTNQRLLSQTGLPATGSAGSTISSFGTAASDGGLKGLLYDFGIGGIDFLCAAIHFFICHSIPPYVLISGVLHKSLPPNFILIFSNLHLTSPTTQKRRPTAFLGGALCNVVGLFCFLSPAKP